VRPLDEILSGITPGMGLMLKIDVEGSELDVIEGAAETIARHRPSIMIELNPLSASAAGSDTKKIVARLVELGYSSFSTPETFPVTSDASRVGFDRQLNLIAIE
jgi:hypothetical protein